MKPLQIAARVNMKNMKTLANGSQNEDEGHETFANSSKTQDEEHENPCKWQQE